MDSHKSTLALAMLGMNDNPEVVSQLLSHVSFPRERPSFWNRYPDIAAELPNGDAVNFASKSAVHALTIAESTGASEQTLDKLASFTQKSVKRSVAANPNLGPQGACRLAAWAVRNSDSEVLGNLATHHDPRVWTVAAQEEAGKNGQAFSYASVVPACGVWLSRQSIDTVAEFLPWLVDALETQGVDGHARSVAEVIAHGASSVHSSKSEEWINEALATIRDDSLRSLVAVTLPRVMVYSNAKFHLGEKQARDLVACANANENLHEAMNVSHRSVGGGVRVDTVSAQVLLDADTVWANRLLKQAWALSRSALTDEQINEIAVRNPSFAVRNIVGSDALPKLTDYTLSYLVMRADAAQWNGLSRDTGLFERLESLPADVSLALALRCSTNVLTTLLLSGKAPSFSAQDFTAAVNSEVQVFSPYRAGGAVKSVAGKILVNDDFTHSPYNRYSEDVQVTAIHCAVPNRVEMRMDTPARQWLLKLMNINGAVTAERAVNRSTDPTHADPWTFAVHYWLDEYLHNKPLAWQPALGLLPDWKGTLSELAVVSAEIIGDPV